MSRQATSTDSLSAISSQASQDGRSARLRKHGEAMAENKLTPPSGHNSWIEYAISTMETRDLYNAQFAADELPWGRVVTRDEMRNAATREYEELRNGR